MMMRTMTALPYKQIQAIRHLKVSFSMAGIIMISILTAFLVMASLQDQIITKAALAQTTTTTTTTKPTTTTKTFSMNGAISSLVLGMSPKTKTVDMTTVQKFILSGDWSMSVDKGKLTNFAANFYTGPANGGISNHTHQISNFRVDNNNTPIIQLSPTKSVSISGISDVGTNGKKAWNNVHTTIVISNGRTIAISLADKDTQAHFMAQQIYGIVKQLNT
jgi:cell division protein ZapA (FtsZ GTPase activity inhibitor)